MVESMNSKRPGDEGIKAAAALTERRLAVAGREPGA